MKRALSILVVLVLCFTMFTITNVSATTTADINMGTATGNIGDTVAVDVNMTSNPGFGVLGLKISYDQTKLQLISVNKTAMPSPFVSSGVDSGVSSVPYKIVWMDETLDPGQYKPDCTYTGKLATLNFKILAGATKGANPVTLEVFNSYKLDATLTTVPTTVQSGSVVVPNTITFDSQGGTAVASKSGAINSTITEPAAPTQTGYTFNGWYDATTGGNKITFPYTITGDKTLYAQWTIGNYAVTYNSNGGSTVAGTTANYNTTLTAPAAPTKTGYTFAGWYKEAALTNAWTFATDKVTAATTLYAKWTANTYTVTFDAAGGSTVASKSSAYNTTITAPTAPTKAGFVFAGWFAAASGGTAVTFPYTVTADTTLYAQWTDAIYTVTFSGTTVPTQSIANNHFAAKPATDPTKTGYTFGGWYKEAAFTTTFDFETTAITANTTVYAKWTALPFTVTIYAEDGTVISTTTNDFDSTIAAPASPTKEGYNFAGWYTAATGGTKITFPYKVAGDTTLYPQFTLIDVSSEPPVSSDDGTSSTPTNPTTGDTSSAAGIALILMLVAAAGVVVTRKKARA